MKPSEKIIKWQTALVLLSLSIVNPFALAQSSAEPPLPEVPSFVREAILQQRITEANEQNYVFREDTNDIRLRKECTWAPKCVNFQVLHYTERHFEIFWLDGVRVARLLPPCDHCGSVQEKENRIMDIPISDSELAAENQRVDREVAEAKALRAQGKDTSSPNDPPQILFSRMLELSNFSKARRQIVEGRSTILLDFVCNPLMHPLNVNEALLRFFSGTVWIDEEEHAVQHVKGKFLADVKLDGGNIKIIRGTQITATNRRVDTGIWLLSSLDARGEGHYFTFAVDGDAHIFVGKYRKFHATSRILPNGTDLK